MKRKVRKKYKSVLTKDFLYQRYVLDKKSQSQIATEVGCATSLVGKYLKKHDIKTRSISESKKGLLASEEAKRNMSRAHKGKMLGKNNPFFGRRHSEETKRKISEANKGRRFKHSEEAIRKISAYHKGKVYSTETREKMSKARRGTKHTEETKRKISEAASGERNPMYGKPRPDMLGSNNPSWKGGRTKLVHLLRGCNQYNIWRQKVYKRDQYTCQHCGSTVSGTLNADHIVPISYIIENNNLQTMGEAYECKILWDISNGRTLCESCHQKTDTWGHGATKYIPKEYEENH